MPMTQQQLLQILPDAGRKAGVFIPVLNSSMGKYGVVTPLRIAAFIAQVGHESGQLRWLKELWGPTVQQAKYEGRADLGNSVVGDGFKFRGRGLIQVTGRTNYANCGKALDLDLLEHPELLEIPRWACESAAWFWQSNGLNELADKGQFTTITRRINGGLNGLDDRVQLWARAKAVLCVS